MSWDNSDLTNDTIYQEGTFGFLFTASGNLNRGQSVRIIADNTVASTIVGSDGIGINDHYTLHGDECTIYLIGNLAIATSPESITPGELLYASSNGFVSASRCSSERPMAISIDTFETATTNKIGKVLLI
jgi:hypothetical protein